MKKSLLIIGIIVLIVSVILTGALYGQVQSCHGLVAKVVGFFDQKTTSNCGAVEFFLYVGYGTIALGILLIILGIVLKK
jgi:hypothetical protein